MDETTRKALEELMHNNSYAIFVKLENRPEPVAVAEIKKCENCPDWLFEKVVKQILGQ